MQVGLIDHEVGAEELVIRACLEVEDDGAELDGFPGSSAVHHRKGLGNRRHEALLKRGFKVLRRPRPRALFERVNGCLQAGIKA